MHYVPPKRLYLSKNPNGVANQKTNMDCLWSCHGSGGWIGSCGFMMDKVALGQTFFELFGFPLSLSFHRGSPCSYIIWVMNIRPVDGRSSETWSHHIDINNIDVFTFVPTSNLICIYKIIKLNSLHNFYC
jgi:hypothetical protein